jgi:hypothetical protein
MRMPGDLLCLLMRHAFMDQLEKAPRLSRPMLFLLGDLRKSAQLCLLALPRHELMEAHEKS